MIRIIKPLLIVFAAFLSYAVNANTPGEDVAKKVNEQLIKTIRKNHENDKAGFSYRNNYIVEVTLDPNWVEEKGGGDKVLKSKYESISSKLKLFNEGRSDKLRAYVVVVNDWQLRLNEQVNVSILPSSVKFDDLAKQTEANHLNEKVRIEQELSIVPGNVKSELQSQGFTDIVVYFGATIKLYTIDGGQPKERKYKYTAISITGNKLEAAKESIKKKVPRIPNLRLEDEIEVGVIGLTEGIEEIIDHKQPLVLANHVSNNTIQSWYSSPGEKSQEPFSGSTTEQQVYDYTGVFASLKNDIINKLPDPTAKVVITDNLTSDAIINNIKSHVSKSLVSNVFWFHLDRKGELHTEIYFAQSVKERLSRETGTVGEDLQLFIGKIYTEAGPKIKSPADLIDFLNIEAHAFRALNNLVANSLIPTEWWDASSPDYLLGVFGKYISPQTGLSFAYVCGLWNGVIGNVSLVTSLLTLPSEFRGMFFKVLVDDQYRTDLYEDLKFYTANIGTLMELGYEMVKSEISRKVEEEWNKLKTGDATGVAFVAGLATVEVVIAIFTAGAAEAVKAGLMSIRLIRVPIEFITKIGSALIKPVALIFKAGGKIVTEGAEYLIKQGDQIVARLTAESKLIIYKTLGAAETIVDEIPIPQNILTIDGDNNLIQDIVFAKTPTGWGFKQQSEFLRMLGSSLANYPALRAKVLTLSSDLQRTFFDDFLKNVDELILKRLNDGQLVDAWKAVNNHADLRVNPKFLENIYSYNDDLLKNLDDDLLNQKWTDELKTLFRESPDDVTKVWKKLKEDPAEAWEISKADPAWEKWSHREFFKNATALGKRFEEVTRAKILNKSSDLYSSLKSSLSGKGLNIDDYEIFSQVQLKYAGDDYFVGDIVMIRKEVNALTGQVKTKAVILETKLRNTTNLTAPQSNALNKIKGSDKGLITRSKDIDGEINKSNILTQNSSLEVEDFIKIWGDGSGEVFSGLNSLIN